MYTNRIKQSEMSIQIIICNVYSMPDKYLLFNSLYGFYFQLKIVTVTTIGLYKK